MTNNLNSIEKQSIFKVLMDIASADGITHPNEANYIVAVIEAIGMSDEEMQKGVKLNTIQAIVNLKEMTESKKIQTLTYMRALMDTDGNVHENESKLFRNVADFIGFEVL